MQDADRSPERVRDFLQKILSGTASEADYSSPDAGLSAMAADSQEADLAVEGMDAIFGGTALSQDQSFALEAIILPRERPVVDVLGDSFHPPPAPWAHLSGAGPRGVIEAAIPSIGRVEIPQHPTYPYAGTGFVVGSRLLMTNRHVAELFATGVGRQQLAFKPGSTSGIDFKQEVLPSSPEIFDVARVVMIHPYWDCALLELESPLSDRSPLELMVSEPSDIDGREVVVVGYPAQDQRNDNDLQNRIFRGIFNRKRMQPGRLGEYRRIRSFGKRVEAITHDSSTLGGNSGSAVIDVETGKVVALHFAGLYLDANFAVPAWELARDSRVVDAGVAFASTPTPASDLPWERSWTGADAAGDAESPASPSGTPTDTTARTPASDDDLDVETAVNWYENVTDKMLMAALRIQPDTTRARLEAAVGAAEAQEVIDDLEEPAQEGIFGTDPDPDLPEIIYLHGIMGGHIAKDRGGGGRLWLNPLAFAAGNIAEKLSLKAGGLEDSYPGYFLGPDGHLRMKYAKAARRWRRKRFVVHEFSYDWRKPVSVSADRLAGFIDQLAAGNPTRTFAIVAHSMGGLISSIYARRHDSWEDRIQRAVFVGSPLGGSYAPIEAVLGVYPFFKTLAAVSRNDGIPDLRELAASLHGLLHMMPNEDLFEDPLDCYAGSLWPAGPKPRQKLLDASRNLKAEILASPLLARTTGVVSREFGTVASVVEDGTGKIGAGPRTGPGDGTVPIQASAVAELPRLYEANGDRHDNLMGNKKVIAAVAELLRDGVTHSLPVLNRSDIDFTEVIPETESLEVDEADVGGLRTRFEDGTMTAADLDYLLDPIGNPLPE